MNRGIVVSSHDIESEGPSVSIRGNIPPEKLRYYLLYWDKIVITDTNIFGSGLSDEQEQLKNSEILQKATARLQFSGTFDGTGLAQLHFAGLAHIASQLVEANPGQWSIHQSGDHLNLPKELSAELISVDITLANCLPVPTAHVPIPDVLEYKERRSAELQALRQTLDELYLEVVNSNDIPRAKVAAVAKLERAIQDLDKSTKESWGQRLLASRKVCLDVNAGSIGQGIATGGLVGAAFSNPLIGIVAGIGQTIISSIKFEVTINDQLKAASGKQLELSYLSKLKAENILER